MKKTIFSMFAILAFASSAFAATTTATTTGAQSVKGGADTATATAAATPLIKFSTGVFGLLNSTPDTTAKTNAGYLIATRHTTGSKNFATASTITNIYWKQVTTGTDTAVKLLADVTASDAAATAFAVGTGWTSY